MSSVKTSDVTGFIKDMIDLTMVYEVDEEGYVVDKKNGERVTVSENGLQSPLLVYQEVIKDQSAQIINPLAESLMNSTASSRWFFDTQKTALLGRIVTLFIAVMRAALDEKKSKTDKEGRIPMELLNMAAKIVDGVDDRLLAEFLTITEDKERTSEFVTIYYQRKQLRSVLRCALFDEEDESVSVELKIPTWKSKFSKIRQKSWPLFETVMLSILNIKDKDNISKFNKKADEISCARLSSFLNVMLAVYQEINPILDMINPDIAIDLSKLAFHINRLSAYADNAKFMAQPSRGVPVQPQHTSVPGVVSTIPMSMPSFATVPGQTQVPGVSLIPGPVFADGRPSAPIAVAQNPGYSSFVPGGVPPMMPQAYSGGYIPQQQPQYAQQQPQYGNIPQNIPFNGPYVQAPNYMAGQSSFGNMNILPPGAPSGFNPRY